MFLVFSLGVSPLILSSLIILQNFLTNAIEVLPLSPSDSSSLYADNNMYNSIFFGVCKSFNNRSRISTLFFNAINDD
jgi:preprotein translocase subunit SecY